LRPVAADHGIPDVVLQPARGRREQGDIDAAFPLPLELAALDRLSDLVVADVQSSLFGPIEMLFLGLAVRPKGGWRGRVVPVDVDDHHPLPHAEIFETRRPPTDGRAR